MSQEAFYEQVMTLDAVDLVVLFAREMSTDPTVLTAISAELSTRRPETKSRSQQDALVAQILEILTERINIEVVATVVSREDFKFQIYFFGVDRPTFSFSLNCFATNPTLTACFSRMLTGGVQRAGHRFFGKQESPPDRSRVVYSNFAYNDLFAAHLFRGSLLLHFILTFVSGIDLYLADQFPRTEVATRAEILLTRVVHDVESRLAQMVHVRGKDMPWVTDELLRIVNTLNNEEKSPQRVKNLFSTAIVRYIAAQ